MRACIVFVALLVFAGLSRGLSQPLNSYAKVNSLSVGRTVLNVTNVNQTNHNFAVGEDVIVVEVQDDVIGGNTNNDVNFGNLSAIGSAGLFEVRKITALNIGGGTITVTPAVTNNFFNFGGNSTVQVVSFQDLGDYTTTANITAVPWDGNIGGIVAIRSGGTFTLAHNITANAIGFLGGSSSTGGNGSGCDQTTYISALGNQTGNKGEGIFKRTSAGQQAGRGKILNGGGGGNNHNGGGGGGSNYTSGGQGGHGYQCEASPVGGTGGIDLSAQISKSRLFMGGGGGGGHQNDNAGSPNAGNGGGLIFFNVYKLVTPSSCSAPAFRTISANGGTAGDAANEGAGGGGAGGSILMDVNIYSVTSGCPLTVAANGGGGGTTNNGASHGGGGGGGQGRIIYTVPQPMTNITTTTNNGTPGCNTSACAAGDVASSPGGSSNQGITDNAGSTPLPVSLIYFSGAYNKETNRFDLQWATATEISNRYFTLQRSVDAGEFKTIAEVDGNGTTSTKHTYTFEDKTGYEKGYYYRLSQTDDDGSTQLLGVIHLTSDGDATADAFAYPNPVNKSDKLKVDLVRPGKGINRIVLFDMQGREMKRFTVNIQDSFFTLDIDTSELPVGVYSLSITSSTIGFRKKIVVK